ncbi:sugar kinase [Testudinibacter sp. P27/CKL/0425]
MTDKQGERSFYYWRNDSAARYWLTTADSDSIVQQLLNFDYLYLSGISVAILDSPSRESLYRLLADFKQQGGKIIFDNNYRSILWDSPETARMAYQRILSLTDIAFLTLDDEIVLWQQENDFTEQQQSAVEAVITRTQRYGVAEIVIKRGSESCFVIQGENRSEIEANSIPADKIIDTTAAGDSFSAGYLAERLQGGSITIAVEQGHKLAGIVIQHRGAIIPVEKMPN